MPRQVVILHGWSDDSETFKPLARFLRSNGFKTHPIHLGDYVSLRDEVRIEDVAKRMEQVVRDAQDRKRLSAKFDLVVHSTGSLVARQWISTYYAAAACPVQNLVMLAPANFGSRLAHLGRSMLGRVVKGWKTGFETGSQMLYALELGSPFQWDLAQRDLFVPEEATLPGEAFYGPKAVRAFVLTGTFPYQQLAAQIVNENGSDGAIRVASANLSAEGMTVDFSAGEEALRDPVITRWRKRGNGGEFPLAVLPDRDHGQIVRPQERGGSRDAELEAHLGRLLLEALGATPASYGGIVDRWRDVSMATRRLAGDDEARTRLVGRAGDADYYNEHFQLVVRAEDEFGTPIPDYFVRFTKRPKRNFLRPRSALDRASTFFHTEVLASVHTHRQAPEHRTFYIDRYDLMGADGWYQMIPDAEDRQLYFSITAADPGERVAYFERRSGARGIVLLHRQGEGERWLRRHTTHFVRVIVPREGAREVFNLKRS